MGSEEAKESSKGVSSRHESFGGHNELKNRLEASLGEKRLVALERIRNQRQEGEDSYTKCSNYSFELTQALQASQCLQKPKTEDYILTFSTKFFWQKCYSPGLIFELDSEKGKGKRL